MTEKEKASPGGAGEVSKNFEQYLKDMTDPEMALALFKLLGSVTNRPQSVVRILSAMVNG